MWAIGNLIANVMNVGRSAVIAVKDNEYDIDKSLQIPYQFTEIQRLKFVAYTIPEDEGEEPKEAGIAVTSLGLIISIRNTTVEFSNKVGKLQVGTEPIDDYRSITMSVGAEKLEKKDLFGKTDPYLEISRKESGGSWTVVHRTEHIKDTHNPQWNDFVLPFNFLCGDDADVDVKTAIDFTGSNGNPQDNTSLHYTGSTNPNAYIVSLRAVGRVLQEYTENKQITAYGYGAKIPPDNEISHDFNLTLDADRSTCAGLEELIPTYCKTLNSVKFWGPTNLAPIINKVLDSTEKTEMGYHILLILIDGVVTDVDETKQALVRASKFPMSVIIVGIGNADFTAMEVYNKGVKGIKSANGESMLRNITKFVTFRKVNLTSLDALSKSLLDEIPSQVVDYYKTNEIIPLCATPAEIRKHTGQNGATPTKNGSRSSTKRKAPSPPGSGDVTPEDEEKPELTDLKKEEEEIPEVSAL